MSDQTTWVDNLIQPVVDPRDHASWLMEKRLRVGW